MSELASVSKGDDFYSTKPSIDGAFTFVGGKIAPYAGELADVVSPIIDTTTGRKAQIGRISMMTAGEAVVAAEHAKAAWSSGMGEWPQKSAAQRIAALEKVVASLKEKRQEIINVLQWEICKTTADATAEFDRTMLFVDATIKAFKESSEASGTFLTVSGISARVRRTPIGVVLCLGPFNYPLNETYTALIPALLMGNCVILKIPTLGGLAHVLTMEAYAQHLPEGVINFVSGSGRATMGPIMKSGIVDALAFIGGAASADAIIKECPNPHRLKLFLQLEGKNLAIVLPDADLDVATEQCLLGSTAYNGQRCTAIKLIFVHESIAEPFVAKFANRISGLKVGLPWTQGVSITPLPEPKKPAYLLELIADAVTKGAKVVNAGQGGGHLDASLMTPAILYPVTSHMKVYHEEQFGPVIPICTFTNVEEINAYYKGTSFGQQAAVFTTSQEAAPLIDILATNVGRINVNVQCARSPDVFPFSGRKSSALGTMSVTEGLNTFSIETVLATKDNATNATIVGGFESSTRVFAPFV
jgi:glyceraldehyde-3-phosphate dehydrogenase (NADP+)